MSGEIKLATFLIAAIMFLGAIAAQNQVDDSSADADTVLVSSLEGSLVSAPVSHKENAPVLRIGDDYVPSSTVRNIRNMDADRIVVVGRSSDISGRVKKKLEDKFGDKSVEIIEGDTNTDTSVQVSQKFWPEGSNKATIVQTSGDDSGFIASLRDDMGGEGPVLVSSSGQISTSTLAEISRLNPDKVVVYADNPENIRSDLNQKGVSSIEVVHRDDATHKAGGIGSITESTDTVLVTVSDSRQSLRAVSSSPKVEEVVVNDRSEVGELVSELNKEDVDRAIVVGDSTLARYSVTMIRSGTNTKVEKSYDPNTATAEVALE